MTFWERLKFLFKGGVRPMLQEQHERAHDYVNSWMKSQVLDTKNVVSPAHFFFKDDRVTVKLRNWASVGEFKALMGWVRKEVKKNHCNLYGLGCGTEFVNPDKSRRKCLVVITQAPGGEHLLSIYEALPGRDLLPVTSVDVVKTVGNSELLTKVF